jgi:hypothetical protein
MTAAHDVRIHRAGRQRPLAFGEFVGDIRQHEHTMGVQASLTYALPLAVALDAGYQVPADSELDPADVYIELAVVLGMAYRVCQYADRIPGWHSGSHSGMVCNAEYHAPGPKLGPFDLLIIYIYIYIDACHPVMFSHDSNPGYGINAASQEQEKLSSRTDVDLRTRLWIRKTLIFRLRKA